MASKKKAKRAPLGRKTMKKTQGGAQVDYFLRLKGVEGEATSSSTWTGNVTLSNDASTGL